MRVLRDAASLMVLLLLVASIRVSPLDGLGNVIPDARAADTHEAAEAATPERAQSDPPSIDLPAGQTLSFGIEASDGTAAIRFDLPRIRVHRVTAPEGSGKVLILEVDGDSEPARPDATDRSRAEPAC